MTFYYGGDFTNIGESDFFGLISGEISHSSFGLLIASDIIVDH